MTYGITVKTISFIKVYPYAVIYVRLISIIHDVKLVRVRSVTRRTNYLDLSLVGYDFEPRRLFFRNVRLVIG